DDDHLRAQQVGDGGDRLTQVPAGVLDESPSALVAAQRLLDEGRHVHLASGGCVLGDQRSAAHVRLEATAAAAPAQRAGLVDREVTELARGAQAAVVHASAQHQAASDAGGDLDVDEVLVTAAGAAHPL